MRALAARIQEGRADLHLSVDELAERAAVPTSAIWRILDSECQGESPPEPSMLNRLAEALHRPREVLYVAAFLDTAGTDRTNPTNPARAAPAWL